MYSVSIPVIINLTEEYGIEKYVAEVKRAKVNRVMLALSDGPGYSVLEDYKQYKDVIVSKVRKAYDIFKAEGYEVGLWIWAFMKKSDYFTHIESPLGSITYNECCPADVRYVEFFGEFISTMASIGLDFILLDDDYRLGFFHNVLMGCTCPCHMKLISEDLGEELKSSDIKDYLLSGGKNKYRSAFIRANRKSLLDFAYAMRAEIDKVNPEVRLGVCSCISSWDIDGADSCEIAKALAGNTKPLLRLIGAPYWAAQNGWGNSLSDVIELHRLERSWCDDDIEIISEDDCYPRPRFYTPGSFVEMFDLALRADGSLSGVLKYMLDYVGSPSYETKYIDAHERNLDLYKKIEEYFGNKKACGVRVFESKTKYENIDIPEIWQGTEFVANSFFPIAPKVLATASVPSKYEGEGVGIAFGENAKYIPENAAKNGLIIDIDAARILNAKGVDVGIIDFGNNVSPHKERFVSGENVRCENIGAKGIKVSEKADIRSIFLTKDGEFPGSYVYFNDNGEKFCVLNFEAYGYTEYNANSSYYRNYERQKDFAYIYKALCGKKLPVHSVGNPYFYLIAKKSKDEKSMAVCAFNFSADEIYDGVIDLDNEYKEITFIAGSGKLYKDKVLPDTIPAYSYAMFEVTK
ncbi:MAG: hypothetical protein E7656_00160 [Ruminococcaceae bacterium]|nr:hypothetical protein [Oscillospiraceae bacterium]